MVSVIMPLVQLVVLAAVIGQPALVWQRNPTSLGPATPASPMSDEESRQMLERQLAPPDEDAGKGGKE